MPIELDTGLLCVKLLNQSKNKIIETFRAAPEKTSFSN